MAFFVRLPPSFWLPVSVGVCLSTLGLCVLPVRRGLCVGVGSGRESQGRCLLWGLGLGLWHVPLIPPASLPKEASGVPAPQRPGPGHGAVRGAAHGAVLFAIQRESLEEGSAALP